MLRLVTNVRARAISASCCSSRWRHRRCRLERDRLKVTPCSMTRPKRLRSSVTSASPLCSAPAGVAVGIGTPFSSTRPATRWPHTPNRCISSSERPAPIRAADAEHFAGTHRQRDVAEECRDARSLRDAERLDLEQRPPGRAAATRVEIFDRAADHEADDFRRIRLRRGQGADGLAVTQHGDAVRDAEHFIQLVRNVDARDAAAAQIPHECEQTLDLLAGERRGRLVQYQHLGTLGDGTRDLDELPARDTEITHERLGVEVHAAGAQDLARARVHLVPVDDAQGAAAVDRAAGSRQPTCRRRARAPGE